MTNYDDRISSYYRGLPVLVTGGASFIGSALVEMLLERGANVTVADDLSSGSRDNLASVMDHLRFLEGDLRDDAFAGRACSGQELVFHLAASHGGRGYIDTHPVECANNMLLDHLVFQAATRAGARKIVYASSACVYPTTLQSSSDDRNLLREEDAGFAEPGGAFADGEYGWAKLMGELQLHAFHKQHGIDGVSCRIFTAYGERENETHAVIALIAKALARMDPYPVWGDGKQTRNFTYVGDTASGLVMSGALLDGYDVINIGTDRHHCINELLEKIFELLDWRPGRIAYQPEMPVGVRSRASGNDKIRRLTGWAPATSLDEGLRRTIDWYRPLATPERLSRLDDLAMQRSTLSSVDAIDPRSD